MNRFSKKYITDAKCKEWKCDSVKLPNGAATINIESLYEN